MNIKLINYILHESKIILFSHDIVMRDLQRKTSTVYHTFFGRHRPDIVLTFSQPTVYGENRKNSNNSLQIKMG